MTDAGQKIIQKIFKTKDGRDKETAMRLKQLKAARHRVRSELEISMNNYNHVTENELMDFYIYKIRSQQALEQYLIREIRRVEKEIS